MEVAEAGLLRHPVQHLAVLAKVHLHGVEIGVVHAVPQCRPVDGQRLAHVVAGHIDLRFGAGHLSAFGIEHFGLYGQRPGHVFQRQAGFHGEARFVVGHAVLVDKHARRSVEQRVDAVLSGHDEVARTVQTAVDVKVAADGEHVAAESVAHPHLEVVVARFHVVGDFGAECGVSAQVVGHGPVVDKHVGSRVGSFKVEEQAFAFHLGGDGQRAFVHHHFAVVLRAARQVVGVPCMGQGHGSQFGFPLCVRDRLDAPFLVQRHHLAGRCRSAKRCHSQQARSQ